MSIDLPGKILPLGGLLIDLSVPVNYPGSISTAWPLRDELVQGVHDSLVVDRDPGPLVIQLTTANDLAKIIDHAFFLNQRLRNVLT